MRFIYYTFVLFLPRNPSRAVAKYLARENTGNDMLDSTPVPLFVSHHEARFYETIDDDTDLFAPSTDAIDSSIFLPDMSHLDDPCSMKTSLEVDEGGSFDLSDSEELWIRGWEDEDFGPLVDSTDLQCRSRGFQPRKPKKEVVPQEPSFSPLEFPELSSGRCPDLIRPIATCCTGRDGMSPFDCWPCTSGFVDDPLHELICLKSTFGSAGAWWDISTAVGRSIR